MSTCDLKVGREAEAEMEARKMGERNGRASCGIK